MTADTAASKDTNGYVRVREFYAAMEEQRREREAMERRLIDRMDALGREIKEITRTGTPTLVAQMVAQERILSQEIADRKREDECLQAGIDEARDGVGNLRASFAWWNGANSIVALVAGLLGINK